MKISQHVVAFSSLFSGLYLTKGMPSIVWRIFALAPWCYSPRMTTDRSYIRVKAMLITPNRDFTAHAVSRHPPTVENPQGFHRLIGGSVEHGEPHQDAIVREVDEELSASIHHLTFLAAVESIFHNKGRPGHEIVFLYTGRLDPFPALTDTFLTEIDGTVLPVVWRPFRDEQEPLPLFPSAAVTWAHSLLEGQWGEPVDGQ